MLGRRGRPLVCRARLFFYGRGIGRCAPVRLFHTNRTGLCVRVRALRFGACCRPSCGGGSRAFRFGGHIVRKVVDMQDVSAGEDARDVRLQVLVHACAAGTRVELNACGTGDLIFGNEAHREQ